VNNHEEAAARLRSDHVFSRRPFGPSREDTFAKFARIQIAKQDASSSLNRESSSPSESARPSISSRREDEREVNFLSTSLRDLSPSSSARCHVHESSRVLSPRSRVAREPRKRTHRFSKDSRSATIPQRFLFRYGNASVSVLEKRNRESIITDCGISVATIAIF